MHIDLGLKERRKLTCVQAITNLLAHLNHFNCVTSHIRLKNADNAMPHLFGGTKRNICVGLRLSAAMPLDCKNGRPMLAPKLHTRF